MSGSGSELTEGFKAGIHKMFDKITKELKMNENYKIDISVGAAKGDGYVAAIFTVTVLGENANKESIKLDCLVKSAPQKENIRKQMNIEGIFKTEVNFYDYIYPAMKSFQEGKKIEDPFNNVAKCYMTSLDERYEALVLENLKSIDYELWPKFESMSEDHFKLVLPVYGKYHALSFALRNQEPEMFKQLTDSIENTSKLALNLEVWKEFVDETVRTEPLELLRNLGHDKVSNAYSKACDEWKKWLEENIDEGDQNVIAHGDCWSNNMMFKNNKNSKPEKVCLLDWQQQLVTTPAWDIGYFYFAAARGQILKDMNKYLKLYYNSFSKFLNELGSSPDKLFPYSNFMKHWKRYGHRPLIMAILVLRIVMQNAGEMPSFEDSKAYTSYTFNDNNKNEDYNKRIVELILAAHENGLLD